MMKIAFALVLGSSLVACTDDGSSSDGDGAGPIAVASLDKGAGGLAPAPAPVALAVDGAYDLRTTMSVEAGALLPATAYDAVQTIQGLRDHPADTLFDLAERAGVPAVGTIRAALPSALESRLDGWIDDAVRGVTTGDGTIAQVIGGVLAIAHAEVGQVHLESQLTIDGATARHRLDTLELDVMGQALAYDVAPLAAIGVELDATCDADVTRAGADATLALGAHTFGLPYGRIAWRAMEDLVRARYGRDLRALLGDQVRCPAIAATVADQCVLGVCVGHESDLRAICEAGLDRAVAELRTRVEAAAVTPIALDAGAATFLDDDGDHVASSLDGTWTARLDLGQGLRAAPSTFTGSR